MLTADEVKILAVEYRAGSDVVEDRFDELYEYYTYHNLMPYGTAKARDGDPYVWIGNQLFIT